MNHKLTKHKLEELKRDKLENMRILQKEISKIDASIKYHDSMYKIANMKSDKANEVLAGYSRENIRSIVKFILGSLIHSNAYFEFYKDVDIVDLIDKDDFFDFLIVEIGRPTIMDIKKHFDKIEIVDGEELLRRKANVRANENTQIRLYKKLTKKTVVQEAKRIAKEG